MLHIDDDARVVKSIARLLRLNGYTALEQCTRPTEALACVERFAPDIVLVDLLMPEVSGLEIVREVHRRHANVALVVLTAEYDARAAVDCIRAGARDFLQKPVRTDELLETLKRVGDEIALSFEAAALREQFFSIRLNRPEAFEEIVTQDERMLRVFAYVESVARGSQPLLIHGETGTGKELVARALHVASGRPGEFVPVNVAGLDDELFSDALFGHVRGAFTGAEKARSGLLERARGGTVLLDEIGDLTEASQTKLLRVLQEREYSPIGSDAVKPLEARVVAATHKGPEALREDLYFRLRSYRVEIPPLRERLGDLPLLVDLFLEAAAEDLGKTKPSVPEALFHELARHPFPGNVRELRALVFDAVARHHEGEIPVELITDELRISPGTDADVATSSEPIFPDPMPSLKAIEGAAIDEALDRTGGNRSAVARMLGISRPKVLRHISGTQAPSDGD